MKILAAALFLFLTACSSTPPAPASESSAAANPAPADTTSATIYRVQPGDLLDISVWKEKDLQKEMMVRPDGGINFPLAGEIIVSGKTVEQLQKDLVTKLTKFVPEPVVTVVVKQSIGNKIFVIGKVNKPGDIIAIRNLDVMQALSMAGGPTPFASVNNIKILRRVNGELTTFPFRYSKVEKGEDLEQNIVLQGGDVVVVP